MDESNKAVGIDGNINDVRVEITSLKALDRSEVFVIRETYIDGTSELRSICGVPKMGENVIKFYFKMAFLSLWLTIRKRLGFEKYKALKDKLRADLKEKNKRD